VPHFCENVRGNPTGGRVQSYILAIGCLLVYAYTRIDFQSTNSYSHSGMSEIDLRLGWVNVLTRGPNSRLPGHWRAGYSAIYVIYAKIGCENVS